MKSNQLSFIIIIILLAACQSKTVKNVTKTDTFSTQWHKPVSVANVFDTIIKPFTDKSYQFLIHIDSLNNNTLTNNALLTFKQVLKKGEHVIFKAKAFCGFPIIERRDMDNDKVDDILIYGEVAGRGANEYYHLYLVDTIKHNLINVKYFDKIVSPQLDSTTNIITGTALYGGNAGYRFYRINSKHQLIDLGHAFEADIQDTIQYPKAISAIMKYGSNSAEKLFHPKN